MAAEQPSQDPSLGQPGQAGGDQGLSTGAKVALGCGGIVLLGLIVVSVVVYAGLGWLGNRADDLVGQAERQAEAEETIERVRQEHAFERPEDDAVPEDRVRTFFAVTDDLWAEVGPWAEELQTVSERMEERDEASFSDLAAGMEGAGRFMEGRALFAEALEAHGMSPEEYVWTGFSLLRAHDELDYDEEERVVPETSLEVARTFDDEIQEFRAPGDDQVPPAILLSMGMAWGWGGEAALEGMGLDTLRPDDAP